MSVPIAASPSRSGFGPQLNLSYDSGSGNGPFGIGWSLPIPSITRKTDKGLPKYRDAEESDVFILSAAEDLVPVFQHNPAGSFVLDKQGNPVYDTEQRDGYTIKRYRPRIEGLFALIERWTRDSDGDAHWRTISKDNVLTVYGATAESRIADPSDPTHIFTWLLCQSFDDKGNAIVYVYAAEDGANVDLSQINERNRVRSGNRYLKYIRYGNRQPLLLDPTQPSFRQSHVPTPDFSSADWMFELVFDYGEGHYREAPPDPSERTFATATIKPPANGSWPARQDPYSTYRSCFEVRCYRLCHRVLLFHHFPDELGAEDYLVGSTEFNYSEKPNGSFLASVAHIGFKRTASAGLPYLKRSLPPLEFEYSRSPLDDLSFNQIRLEELDPESHENLPAGIDAKRYRWMDLDGEGIAGVFTEDSGAWFYKRNLGGGRFAPVERLSPQPSFTALHLGRQQFLDLAGDGNLDLVDFAAPAPGYFSRTDDAAWDRFKTFKSLPEIDWQDPDLRFIDLTGDGHADVLLTEDQAYSTWFESLAEEGFGRGSRVAGLLEEERGPRLVFADGTESIYVADMSGDGLSDLVRIRNGEVCYWPNTGYGRFGAKVALDGVGWFDDAESFDQRRVRLTDTDGSGPTDIVYLGCDGIRIYLNQHGNSLSAARLLERIPQTDNFTSISVVDFLGRGTACLVWSSPLTSSSLSPIRFLDLMGGIKPHLLTLVRNNLGSETRLEYKSSTEFYLADRAAGTPWTTRLPFPVHVVTRVETRDLFSGNRFSTTYTYHHGHFDGFEREFRGFGRVEQRDTEEFGVLAPASNLDRAFHVPPVLTKTWFHTGAYFARGERVSRQFEDEYYREAGLSEVQTEAMLLDDTTLPEGLADSERREAVRSLKGALLRQEIYALDDTPASSLPYFVSERNYTIKPLQPQAMNRHSVFFTHARESIDFHYERKTHAVAGGNIVDGTTNPGATFQADPRVTHNVNLAVNDYGNTLRSVAIGYGRRFEDSDPNLNAQDRKKQKQLRTTFTESSFTTAVLLPNAYRVPYPAEAITYEVLKLNSASTATGVTRLLRFDELAAGITKASDGAHDLPYEDFYGTGALGAASYRRLIEQTRTRYRSNNLAQLLPLNSIQALALPGESYRLAFTPELLNTVYQNQLPDPGAVLRADSTWADRGGYIDLDGNGNWWIPSGRVFFHTDPNASAATELTEAVRHFFQPRRFRDPFAHDTLVDYAHDFLPTRSQDILGNITEAIYDYRVLQPKQVIDHNGNRAFAAFDALGLPVASAVRGKVSETLGDSLDDFLDFDADPATAELQAFFANPLAQAPSLLKSASSRFVYDVDRFKRCAEPTFAAVLIRESHVSDPLPSGGLRIQSNFVYSDGFGRELQTKIPAEPGDAALRGPIIGLPSGDIKPGPVTLGADGKPVQGSANPRWVGKGRTIYNNKGKPVKQYESFFSSTHLYEPEPEMTDTGVTPIFFYNPVERQVAKLNADHTYEKIVLEPWHEENWDVNDTVAKLDPKTDVDVGGFFTLLPAGHYLPTWYDQRRNGQKGLDEKNAAERAAGHKETPTVRYFDSLGRTMLIVADNGTASGGLAQKLATRITLDIEGNQREVIDAQARVVVRYDYDMLGNQIGQSSMDAGRRSNLRDVFGKPVRTWDSRGHKYRTEYDELRRPARSFAIDADPTNSTTESCFDVVVYGESAASGLTVSQMQAANLRGRIYKHFDTAGIATTDRYDFKGNLLNSSRQFVKDYKTPPNWSNAPPLVGELWLASTSFDALNRPLQVIPPRSDKAGTKLNVLQPSFNEGNLLERVDVWLSQSPVPTGVLDPVTASLSAVRNLDYNARGQRTRIDYGNGATTEYFYDDQTFRLIRLKTTATVARPPGLLGRLRGRGPTQNASTYQDLNYTYDPAGNILHIRDDAQETLFYKGQVVAPVSDYFYDPVYRLIKATGRESIGQHAAPQTNWSDEFRVNLAHPADGTAMRNYTEQYFYDEVGNFDRLVHQAAGGDWTRTYTYNETSMLEGAKKNNRLSLTTTGSANEPYQYDSHGNMIAMPHLTSIAWDFRDQLSASSRQARHPSSPATPETTYYVYDSNGQRTRKVTEGLNGTLTEERIYAGESEVYRQYAAGASLNLERETVHVMDDKQRIALVESRTFGNDGSSAVLIRYQFGDYLGSSAIELDDAAQMISYEEYYPYGSTSYQALDKAIRAAAKRYRFTGKERDEETGFTYYGARYYASWLGVWTAPDPMGLGEEVNLYRFCRNTPVVLADPDGHEPFDPQAGHPFVKWLLYGKDTPIRDAITNDRNLEKAEIAAAVVTIVALTVATGGVAGEVALAAGATQTGATAASVIVGGATYRGLVSLAKGESPKEAAAKAADPEAIVDSLILAGAPEPPPGSLSARTGPPRTTNTSPRPGAGAKPAAPKAGGAAAPAKSPALKPAAASGPTSPAPTKVPNPDGAKGSPATQAQNKAIGDELAAKGEGGEYNITGGGGREKEKYFPGPQGGNKGSVRIDNTAEKPGDRLHVQTVTTRGTPNPKNPKPPAPGKIPLNSIPDKREMRNAGKILKNDREAGLILVPKNK